MGEAVGHEVDGGELDHGCRSVGVGFVVAGQAAVVHEPAEGAFDDPAAGLDMEAADAGVVAFSGAT